MFQSDGPSMEPCLTPVFMLKLCPNSPLHNVFAIMPSCNFRIAVALLLRTPHFFSRRNQKMPLTTESKAFFKSTNNKNTPTSSPFIERKHSRILRTTSKPSADPCSGLNPTCVSGTSLPDRSRRVLLRRIAWTLEAMLRRTIPRQLFQSLRAPFLLYRGIKMESNHDAGTSSPLQSFCTVVVS